MYLENRCESAIDLFTTSNDDYAQNTKYGRVLILPSNGVVINGKVINGYGKVHMVAL